jgi:hypothetical protein
MLMLLMLLLLCTLGTTNAATGWPPPARAVPIAMDCCLAGWPAAPIVQVTSPLMRAVSFSDSMLGLRSSRACGRNPYGACQTCGAQACGRFCGAASAAHYAFERCQPSALPCSAKSIPSASAETSKFLEHPAFAASAREAPSSAFPSRRGPRQQPVAMEAMQEDVHAGDQVVEEAGGPMPIEALQVRGSTGSTACPCRARGAAGRPAVCPRKLGLQNMSKI